MKSFELQGHFKTNFDELARALDDMMAEELMIDPKLAKVYTESLVQHIDFVREAGQEIGVPIEQLDVHDESKWGIEEFIGYAKHFHGGGAPDEFALAWLHHIHNNPHHWQYWMFPDGFTPDESEVVDGCIEMPQRYALEMIADWMGASKAYTGSWDMKVWLVKNTTRIKLHPNTAIYVSEVLDTMGYIVDPSHFKT